MKISTLKISAMTGRLLLCKVAIFTCVIVASLLAGTILPTTPALAKPPIVKQEQIKAVYLYNFLHFVTWPKDPKLPSNGKPMIIGIIGNSPVKESLEELRDTVSGTKKTTITLKQFENFSPETDFSGCHILFVSDSEKNSFSDIIAKLANKPILTVGNSKTFLRKGGMVLLTEYKGKIRYQINRKNAEKAGLRINSQLLKSSLKRK